MRKSPLLPEPPYLPPKISEWEPEELFSLVKHGVKLTGMPAWPAQQRDDEVWAMVAFLLRFQDLDAEEYRRLVYGGIPPAPEAAPVEGLARHRAPVSTSTKPRCLGGIEAVLQVPGRADSLLHQTLSWRCKAPGPLGADATAVPNFVAQFTLHLW